ncbi:MAG: sulfatase [Myxococcota bacterium]
MKASPILLIAGLMAAACSGTSTPPAASVAPKGVTPAWEGQTFARPDGTNGLLLDSREAREAATWVLPESNPGLASSGSFDLSEQIRPQGAAWAVPLPFRIPESQRRFAPAGMQVFVDDTEVFFTTSGVARRTGQWKFQGNMIVVGATQKPTSVRIEYPGVAQAIRRLDPTASGLTAAEFVDHRLLLDPQSREGLLLPVPTRGAWANVEIPEQATFTAHAAISPGPLAASSDGADVLLELATDAGTVLLAKTRITPGPAFETWTADLSEHAGKTGTLVLRTADDDPTNDLVFLGSPQLVGTPRTPIKRVIVVGIDTLRPDHMGAHGYERDTTPELDAWAESAVIFDKAFTAAPRTRPSFRSATTGRLPLEAVCAPNLAETFDANGWATAGITANIHLNARFGFDKGSDFWWLDGKAKVDDQVDRAMAWLKENENVNSYMFLHVMDPHIFYRAPAPYGRKWVKELGTDVKLPKPMFNRSDVYAWLRNGKLTEEMKDHIEALYDGEMSYTSAVLGKFLEDVDALEGETLVVLHNDHGEEFFEHGGFEHNHTLYQDVVNGLLWIRPPGGTGQRNARSQTPASITDIGATVLSFAGFGDLPEQDGQDLLPSLRGETRGTWTRPIPVAHLRYDADQWGVIWNDHKYIITTRTGAEELYNLANDPGETNNIAARADTATYATKLGEAHQIDIGPGWRIPVVLSGAPLTLHLPAPATSAGIIDPETIANRRVNQAWGEVPPTTAEDVGSVTLEDDKQTLRITPGPKGRGMLYVRFDELPTGEVRLSRGDDARSTTVSSETATVSLGKSELTIKPGTVLVPPPDEAARMRSCRSGIDDVDADSQQMLIDLGYLEGDAH